jgi:hypothetical protein
VLFGPIASALLCNCSEYKKECIPYCKSTYVYKNKLERNNITGEVKVVNKKPFIDLVKNKIQNNDIIKNTPPLAVPQIPIVTSTPVVTPQVPILTTTPQIPFSKPLKYELNGNTLKYNDIDYDVCNDRTQIMKLSGLDEEFKRIYEMISNTNQLRTRCPVQIATTRTKTVEETTTKTRTVETTSVQTRSSTEIVLITTTKKVEQLETITKKPIIRPNPIESTVTVSNRQCNANDMSYNCNVERQAPNFITVTRDLGMPVQTRSQMPSIVTVTRDSAMRNQPQNQIQPPSIVTITRDLPTQQQRVSTVFVNRNQSDNNEVSISTVIKTTVIPKVRTITKEITSTRTSRQGDKTESTRNLKTRYITNVETSTKTLYNTQKSTESTMYSMLLQLQDLLTKVKGIADSKTMNNKTVEPSTIKGHNKRSNNTTTKPDKTTAKSRSKDKTKTRTFKNDAKSNEESSLNDKNKDSRLFTPKEANDSDSEESSENKATKSIKTKTNKKSKSRENDSVNSSSISEQDKLKTILKELSIIKDINMSLIKKKDEPKTVKRSVSSSSLTKNKSSVSSTKTKSFDKSNSEDFTKKVLEVLGMKKTEDKNITVTKTLTINKTSPYFSMFQSSQSLDQSVDNDKKVTKNVTSSAKQTITLRQTVTKTIKESKSITKTTSKVKTKSFTKTKSLISILPVTVSSVNHSTETDSGVMKDVKDKIYKIFKKQSQSQLQSKAQSSSVEYFHNFVSENVVSLASAISDIKKSEIKVKSDDKVEKTVTIGQKENKRKVEIEINAMKNKFDKMLENLKTEMMKEENKREVIAKDKEDEDGKVKRDLIKDNEDINDKDDLKESNIVKHEAKDDEDEDKMKLKSILLFSMTPQSTTTSLPVLSIEITTTIPKQVTFSSLIKQKSVSLISETSSTIKEPSTVVIKSTTTEEPSTVTVESIITEKPSTVILKSTTTEEPVVLTVKSTTTEEPSTVTVRSTRTDEPTEVLDKSPSTKTKPTVLDKSTSTKSSSSMSPRILASTLTVTSPVSNKSEFKLSKTRPESSIVSKTKSCKRGSSECVIDIPVTAIPKSLDIIYE